MIPASLLTAGPWPYQGGPREIHLDAERGRRREPAQARDERDAARLLPRREEDRVPRRDVATADRRDRLSGCERVRVG
jgi:hypothetical protein